MPTLRARQSAVLPIPGPAPAHTPPFPGRRKYKEETTRLTAQLRSTSAGTKGTEKVADRMQKEIDKLRCAGHPGGSPGAWQRASDARRLALEAR